MSYQSWFNKHADKHTTIVEKLISCGKKSDEIIDYFDYENMVKEEPDFCPLYKENKKCHAIEELNCYLCACPNFRFKDEGIKRVEEKMQYSFCSINSKHGMQGVYSDKIHQDCSKCEVPHLKSYITEHFDLNWKKIMQKCTL
ncbi:MAG: hypothetical protein NTW78_00445 [Campylobacterales bacterium]|nr:hypothetical protein [Campylobacterales bacterium]